MPRFVPSNPRGALQIRFLKGICSRAAVPRGLQLPSRVGGDLLCSGKRGRIASQPLLVLPKIISNSFPAAAGGRRQGQLLRQGWCKDVALQGWILQSNPSGQRGQKTSGSTGGCAGEANTSTRGRQKTRGRVLALQSCAQPSCTFQEENGMWRSQICPPLPPGCTWKCELFSSAAPRPAACCPALSQPHRRGAPHTRGVFFNLPIITHPS